MKYKSTRGAVSGLTFEQALLSGYASDGGLFVPEAIPTLTKEDFEVMKNFTYRQIVLKVVSLFISSTEVPYEDLRGLVDSAFHRFKCDDVIQSSSFMDGTLNILELFHGPTMAFKDLALSLVAQFLEYFLKKKNKHVTILVGTSGDTGGAAIESVKGLSCVDIIVLYPKDRCSQIQELQMTTVDEGNIHVFRVDGTSDDLDHPIKRCFVDPKFPEEHSLCGINSINWARILFQVAHYFFAYFKHHNESQQIVEIAIPTGACGNCTAGVVAQDMGLPVKLVCCVNVNDIVHRTLQTGDFSLFSRVTPSLSSAMDIQVPYNMERLIYFKSDGNSGLTKFLMGKFEETGRLIIPQNILDKMNLCMDSHRVNDKDILSTITWFWTSFGYAICPHTATAVHYHLTRKEGTEMPLVCIATASPIKFPEVLLSVDVQLPVPHEVESLKRLPSNYVDMRKSEDWEHILKMKIESITRKYNSN